MSTANILTVSGLSADIIGVILLWRFGLPTIDVRRDGNDTYLAPKPDPRNLSKVKFYDRMSHVALTLIVIGFILQMIPNLLCAPSAPAQ